MKEVDELADVEEEGKEILEEGVACTATVSAPRTPEIMLPSVRKPVLCCLDKASSMRSANSAVTM